MYGSVSELVKMQNIYFNCQVILLTSAYEGFPMVIKEGMANACIPVVTALVGNKTHLQNGLNALLIEEIENEELVVQQGIEQLQKLIDNPILLYNLSMACRKYAEEKFDKTNFVNSYRQFLKQ
jgi:glycosyltransferase involved in cell wall biosynthesis